jgi:glycosyltransferase involved in cell wall biosynthesis
VTVRILAVLHSSDIGGTEVCYSRLLEVLARRDDVEIVGLYPPGPMVEQWEKVTPWAPYRAGSLTLRFDARSYVNWWRAGRKYSDDIVEAARKWRPDAIVSLTSVLTAPAGVASRLGIPCVAYVREYMEPALTRRLLWRFFGRKADEIIAVSSPLARALEPYAPGRVHMVHDGVPIPPMPVRDEEAPRIVAFFGGFDPLKGADILVEALPRVHRDHPDVRFVFYGHPWPVQEGFVERFSERARELGVPVEFVRTREFEEGQSTASVVVCPSRLEGLGVVALECMARGVPVVASDVGGLPDVVVDGETGRLVPPENPERLGAAISEMLSDEPARRRMGLAARERAERLFGIEASAQGLLDAVQAAIDRHAADGRSARS